MPGIIIERKKSWLPLGMGIRIFLNGHPAGSVNHGEKLRLLLPAGEHTLEARSGIFKSKKINFGISNPDARRFEVKFRNSGIFPKPHLKKQ